ncbi:MAG: sugar transferase [Sediminibacterium sp.]|nr:sugar transferase [Sediminibacterium sp.]
MIRFFDIIFSILGLIFLSPVFLVILLAIKITSKGPVFYMQSRVGKQNADFKLFKFRTMYVNAEKSSLLTIGDKDKRITKTGFFLRKYKLDELPQLLNVLIGNMSLVGPRPEVRKYVNFYTPAQMGVLSVKPGITDWASIIYRDENKILARSQNPELEYINTILPEKIKYNQIFIKNFNSFEYFKILSATILKVIFPGIQFKFTNL